MRRKLGDRTADVLAIRERTTEGVPCTPEIRSKDIGQGGPHDVATVFPGSEFRRFEPEDARQVHEVGSSPRLHATAGNGDEFRCKRFELVCRELHGLVNVSRLYLVTAKSHVAFDVFR